MLVRVRGKEIEKNVLSYGKKGRGREEKGKEKKEHCSTVIMNEHTGAWWSGFKSQLRSIYMLLYLSAFPCLI